MCQVSVHPSVCFCVVLHKVKDLCMSDFHLLPCECVCDRYPLVLWASCCSVVSVSACVRVCVCVCMCVCVCVCVCVGKCGHEKPNKKDYNDFCVKENNMTAAGTV